MARLRTIVRRDKGEGEQGILPGLFSYFLSLSSPTGTLCSSLDSGQLAGLEGPA